MSHVEFKKCSCRPVYFRGQGPSFDAGDRDLTLSFFADESSRIVARHGFHLRRCYIMGEVGGAERTDETQSLKKGTLWMKTLILISQDTVSSTKGAGLIFCI